MKKLVLTTVSALALGIAAGGTGIAQTSSMTGAQTPSSATMPQSSQAQTLSQTQVRQVQEQLKSAGLYRGAIDGDVGPETKQAIAQFQQQNGLNQTGALDQPTLSALSNQGMAGSTMSNPAGSTMSNPAGSTMGGNPSAQPPSAGSSGSLNQPTTAPSTTR